MDQVAIQLDATSRRRYLMTLILFNFKPNTNLESIKQGNSDDEASFKASDEEKIENDTNKTL